MLELWRWPAAIVLMVLGVALGAMSAGPWSWGFGALVGALISVGGYSLIMDRGK